MKVSENILSAYKDYVTVLVRRYLHNLPNKSEAEVLGWTAVNKVYVKLNPQDKAIIDFVFGTPNTVSDNIFDYSIGHSNLTDDDVWIAVKRFEKYVAQERGLI